MKALRTDQRYVGQVRGARELRIRRIDDRTASAGFCSGSRRWRAPMGSAAYDPANRSAGSSCSFDHHGGHHRRGADVGFQRARYGRPQDVGSRIWRSRGSWSDAAHDGGVSIRGSALLRRTCDERREHRQPKRDPSIANAPAPARRSGAGAGDCQLDHGRSDFLRRRIALVHCDDQRTASDGWALGARASGKLRPATEPRLCAAHPIPGLLSSSRRNLRLAGSCESVRS